jgi:hypothetical protein
MMMKPLRTGALGALILTIGFLWAQKNIAEQDVAPVETWELAPMVVVYPDEQLTILTTAPLPAYRTMTYEEGTITLRKPLWHAIGGHFLHTDERTLVYQAPGQEGVYLVYWSDGTRKFGFFVKVNERGWGEIAEEETIFEGQRGVFLPLARAESSPVGLFLVNQRSGGGHGIEGDGPSGKPGIGFVDNQGSYRFDPPNKPFFPNRRPHCSNGQCDEVREYQNQTLGYQRELGTIKLEGTLSIKLEGIGIEHTRGATINVTANVERTLHIDKIDCYRCENGRCEYIGSRVEYLVCEKVSNYLAPQWMCDAIRRWRERYPADDPLFPDFPPCQEPITVERGCKYSGDCPCPPRGRPAFGRACT